MDVSAGPWALPLWLRDRAEPAHGGSASPFSPPFDSEPLYGSALTPFPPPPAFSHLLAAEWTEFGACCGIDPGTNLLGPKHVPFLHQLTNACWGSFPQSPLVFLGVLKP